MSKMTLPAFLVGFLAVLVFHQGTVFLLHHWGNGMPAVTTILGITGAPFDLSPVSSLGVPRVLSLAFWGGIWGIVLAFILVMTRPPDLLFGFVFGALAVTLVGFTVVAALKGLPMFAGGNPQAWVRAALLDGAWGWGAALLLRSILQRSW